MQDVYSAFIKVSVKVGGSAKKFPELFL